jgi:hypothetical protein
MEPSRRPHGRTSPAAQYNNFKRYYLMSKRIALVMGALLLAAGAAGAASAADTAKKPSHVTQPRSQASLQCSAQADAKGLHGKARVSFRRDCLRKAAGYHKTSHHTTTAKKIHPATLHQKPDKVMKKT